MALPPTVSPRWRLETLVGAHLLGTAGPVRIDRRAALAIAYLALEGPQPRARLAPLLWPDTPDAGGRANLRQLLRRLHRATDGTLIDGGDPLALSEMVELDIAPLLRPPAADERARMAEFPGEFFAGVELDDIHEDLAAWVATTRAASNRARVRACLDDAQRLADADDLPSAIARAQRALWLDPLHEVATQALMRLYYASGDGAAAMAAYARCRLALRDQLGVEPSAGTAALADEIRRARARSPATTRRALPIAVQRPPRFAGRRAELVAMEQAWAAGQGIALSGAPGMGKSRLMQEFMTRHSRPLYFRGRPGDSAVPYGTHARTYRELITSIGGPDKLPRWVRHEIARILPQFGDAPGLIDSEADRLRFWSAKVEIHRLAYAAGFDALGFDDLQFIDPASATAGQWVLAQLHAESETPIRTVHCYRRGSLPEPVNAILDQMVDAGAILRLELAPLDDSEVGELVATIDLPGLDALAGPLSAFAGGNPLYVLETVKHLLETNGGTLPASPLPAGQAATVLAARLARLAPVALELVRVLAIARDEFSLELAAQVTEVPADALEAAWDDLEAARLVREHAFAHDLIAEAVLASMPARGSARLHARVAAALDLAGAPAGRRAALWAAAGRDDLATPLRRQARLAARTSMDATEASGYFDDPSSTH